ncbi:hypothetical protein VPH35_041765 [Triticum aestivum]
MAFRKGQALAQDLYINRIHIASDCKTVVTDILEKNSSSEYGAIIQEIFYRSSLFNSCNIAHEFRSSNFEAHNLTRHALQLGFGRHVWLGQPGDLVFLPVNILVSE